MRIYIDSQKLSSCHRASACGVERFSQSNYHAAWKVAEAIFGKSCFYFTMQRRGRYFAEPHFEGAAL